MDTPTYSTTDIVNFAVQKDAVNLATAFNQMIGQKVADAVQARKIEVASTMFNEPEAGVEQEASSEEVPQEEQQPDDTVAAAADGEENDSNDVATEVEQNTETGTGESDEDTKVNN